MAVSFFVLSSTIPHSFKKLESIFKAHIQPNS